ncbi:MAG: hypothetical protein ACD_54C01155G0003 [uncultured bacterium]|nr:MAG: hypothetical protein ACD_54C01155G0003 [uncultured bacterium]
MHQIIGKDLVIPAFERPQHRPGQPQPRRPAQNRMHPRHQRAYAPASQNRQRQLHQQEHNRIKRGNHRPLAQPHQPKQRARSDIGPSRAQQLQIGAQDPARHRGFDDISPDQHLDIRRCHRTIDRACNVPAVRPLYLFRFQINLVARNPRLRLGLFPIQLAVAARVDRIIAGDIKHPPAPHALIGISLLGDRFHRTPLVQIPA